MSTRPASALAAPRPTGGRDGRPLVSADRVASLAAVTVIAAGALAVVALWWQDTLFITGLGDWLTNAGRQLTGRFPTALDRDSGGGLTRARGTPCP